MALRAGYYGLKGAMKKTLEKLASDTSGMKIIKTIGDGLKLTQAGKISVDIDSNTMEFKTGGKLAAKAVAVDYASEEVNTGVKWIDGKDIYRKVFTRSTAFSFTATNSMALTTAECDPDDIAQPISARGLKTDEEFYSIPLTFWLDTGTPSLYAGDAWSSCNTFIIEYTKTESTNE